MRGTIAKKKNLYYPVVDLGRDPQSGKRKRKWHSPGFRKQEDAEARLTEILYGLQRGSYVPPDKLTVARFFLGEWLPSIEGAVGASTFALHRINVNAYIVPELGSIPLQSLTTPHVNGAWTRLRKAGRRDGRGGLAPKTTRNIHGTLYRGLADAVRWGRVLRNVAEGAVLPKMAGAEMLTWTPREMNAFLDHVKGDRLFAAWLLLARSGVRRGELLGLHWRDLNLSRGSVSICSTLTVIDNKLVLRPEVKSRKGRRVVPLESETVAALRAHRAAQLQERMIFGSAYQDLDLVFSREDGALLHPHTFSRTFTRRARDAGLPRIRLHDVRHSFATHALEAGIPAKVVSELLGHADVSITLSVYSHVSPSMQQEAIARVAALVRGDG